MSLADGKLIIAPVAKPESNLKQLLAKVTAENIHHEVETGPASGNEIW
jgi:antitoxin MazE